ncbi:hypothetical protein K505DRAFT_329090 [Melanomma pulvis-pyrius CBS 109.77]|uniref:Uncharacterized protein n=1 Tax=Melanomma pulvis-pyrius CBS 109.77 TaxID=1314802 RepID=A0A6A6WWH1_9PLEO|nr:hypothetical protein K505DRAFT_329090 [Melanomma pulvis-pyrius CBS 109.77]
MLCDGLRPCFVPGWTDVGCRGSEFLKKWMGFLEEKADLRYPNLASVYVDDGG